MTLFWIAASTLGLGQADPTGDYRVEDLVVIEGSAYAEGLNSRGRFASALPRSLAGRRAVSEDGAATMPAGVITFHGEPSSRVDVLLEFRGRAVASVPSASQRSGRMLWTELTLAARDAAAAPRPVSGESWLQDVREAAEGLSIVAGTASERLLLYDIELDGTADVGLEVADDVWTVANRGRQAVTEAAVIRPDGDDRWRVGVAPTVPAAPVAEAPAEEAAGGEADAETDTDQTATAQPAAQMPTAGVVSAGKRDGPASREEVSFGPPLSADDAVATYADRLPDVTGAARAHLRAVLRSRLSAESATLVYRLDPAEHTRLLSLEVTPQPRAVRRTALVLVTDADPTILERVDSLIARLGDDAWRVREEAERELGRLGRLAEPALRKAVTSEDPEIANRAQRLAEDLTP